MINNIFLNMITKGFEFDTVMENWISTVYIIGFEIVHTNYDDFYPVSPLHINDLKYYEIRPEKWIIYKMPIKNKTYKIVLPYDIL